MSISLVTGTSTGSGLGTAIRLAQDEHHVYASMRDPEKAGPLFAAAREAGVQVEVVALDVTDETSIQETIDAILERDGRVDNRLQRPPVVAGPFARRMPVQFERAIVPGSTRLDPSKQFRPFDCRECRFRRHLTVGNLLP